MCKINHTCRLFLFSWGSHGFSTSMLNYQRCFSGTCFMVCFSLKVLGRISICHWAMVEIQEITVANFNSYDQFQQIDSSLLRSQMFSIFYGLSLRHKQKKNTCHQLQISNTENICIHLYTSDYICIHLLTSTQICIAFKTTEKYTLPYL